MDDDQWPALYDAVPGDNASSWRSKPTLMLNNLAAEALAGAAPGFQASVTGALARTVAELLEHRRRQLQRLAAAERPFAHIVAEFFDHSRGKSAANSLLRFVEDVAWQTGREAQHDSAYEPDPDDANVAPLFALIGMLTGVVGPRPPNEMAFEHAVFDAITEIAQHLPQAKAAKAAAAAARRSGPGSFYKASARAPASRMTSTVARTLFQTTPNPVDEGYEPRSIPASVALRVINDLLLYSSAFNGRFLDRFCRAHGVRRHDDDDGDGARPSGEAASRAADTNDASGKGQPPAATQTAGAGRRLGPDIQLPFQGNVVTSWSAAGRGALADGLLRLTQGGHSSLDHAFAAAHGVPPTVFSVVLAEGGGVGGGDVGEEQAPPMGRSRSAITAAGALGATRGGSTGSTPRVPVDELLLLLCRCWLDEMERVCLRLDRAEEARFAVEMRKVAGRIKAIFKQHLHGLDEAVRDPNRPVPAIMKDLHKVTKEAAGAARKRFSHLPGVDSLLMDRFRWLFMSTIEDWASDLRATELAQMRRLQEAAEAAVSATHTRELEMSDHLRALNRSYASDKARLRREISELQGRVAGMLEERRQEALAASSAAGASATGGDDAACGGAGVGSAAPGAAEATAEARADRGRAPPAPPSPTPGMSPRQSGGLTGPPIPQPSAASPSVAAASPVAAKPPAGSQPLTPRRKLDATVDPAGLLLDLDAHEKAGNLVAHVLRQHPSPVQRRAADPAALAETSGEEQEEEGEKESGGSLSDMEEDAARAVTPAGSDGEEGGNEAVSCHAGDGDGDRMPDAGGAGDATLAAQADGTSAVGEGGSAAAMAAESADGLGARDVTSPVLAEGDKPRVLTSGPPFFRDELPYMPSASPQAADAAMKEALEDPGGPVVAIESHFSPQEEEEELQRHLASPGRGRQRRRALSQVEAASDAQSACEEVARWRSHGSASSRSHMDSPSLAGVRHPQLTPLAPLEPLAEGQSLPPSAMSSCKAASYSLGFSQDGKVAEAGGLAGAAEEESKDGATPPSPRPVDHNAAQQAAEERARTPLFARKNWTRSERLRAARIRARWRCALLLLRAVNTMQERALEAGQGAVAASGTAQVPETQGMGGGVLSGAEVAVELVDDRQAAPEAAAAIAGNDGEDRLLSAESEEEAEEEAEHLTAARTRRVAREEEARLRRIAEELRAEDDERRRRLRAERDQQQQRMRSEHDEQQRRLRAEQDEQQRQLREERADQRRRMQEERAELDRERQQLLAEQRRLAEERAKGNGRHCCVVM